MMNVCDVTNKRKRSITNETSSKLWHCRLGHISKGRMECLIREEILHQLDFSDSEHCIDCIKGKYVKQNKKGAIRSSGLLELIHTDICGPFSVTSVNGFSYFITFTDDYSRYEYIFPYLDNLKHFISSRYLRLKHNLKIKVVTLDHGGEYL